MSKVSKGALVSRDTLASTASLDAGRRPGPPVGASASSATGLHVDAVGRSGIPGVPPASGYRREPRHPWVASCKVGAPGSSGSVLPVGASGFAADPLPVRRTGGQGVSVPVSRDAPFPYWIRGVHGAPRDKEKPMFKKWRVLGPSGYMETMAKSRRRAIANIRWRLQTECGLSRYAASSYDLSDIREVE